MKHKFSTRMLSVFLAAVMIFGTIGPVAVFGVEAGQILSVTETSRMTVPYGTTLEEAIARLPEAVTGQKAVPLVEVEGFSYDFEDAAQAGSWNILSSLIKVENGLINYPKNSNVKATVGPETLTDFVVEADILLAAGADRDAGIMIRTTEATNKGPDSYNGYYVGFGVLDLNEKPHRYGIKTGYADGGWHDVSMYELSAEDLDMTKRQTLKLVVCDEYVGIFVKEADEPESAFQHVKTEKQTVYSAGSVGLRSYQQAFDAEAFRVRAVTQEDLAAAGIQKAVEQPVAVAEWTCANYDGNTAGNYTFVGTLAEGEGYTLPEGLSTSTIVTVQDKPASLNYDHSVPFNQVQLTDGFWSNYQKAFICQVIPTAIKNISTGNGGIPNFKTASEYLATKPETGYTTDDAPAHKGARYVDSDVYKVVEAMAYALQLDAKGDAEMLAGQAYIAETLETWIPWFVGSQEADGYLYTCFTLKSTDQMTAEQARFTGRRDVDPVKTDGTPYDLVGTAEYNSLVDFDDHELYCIGHFYEAAVAHYRATGDFRLLDVAVKNADLVARTFGPDDATQVQAVPGHQEIELALIKLANVCNEIGGEYAAKSASYIQVAKFFLDERGKGNGAGSSYKWNHDGYNVSASWYSGKYSLDLEAAADLTEGYGHCVRAEYQYTAMADVALMEIAAGNENPYDAALKNVWNDLHTTKQYITGGVGLSNGTESFGEAYEAAPGNAYCETCAQVANSMWAQRMSVLYDDSQYANQIETNLYNSIISCVNLDGNQFFYGNPIQSNNGGLRSNWFGTACCPPNLLRTVCAIGGYIYAQNADGSIIVDQYIGNTAALSVGEQVVHITLETDMPWNGNVKFTVKDAVNTTVSFRVPAWATGENTLKINGETAEFSVSDKGYLSLNREWKAGDTVELYFPMEVTLVETAEGFKNFAGMAAVRRGPIVYAAETYDNPEMNIPGFVLTDDIDFTASELTNYPNCKRNETSHVYESHSRQYFTNHYRRC